MSEVPEIPSHSFTFTLRGQQHVLHIARDLSISLDHLDDCFRNHAGIRNHYAFLYRAAESQLEVAEDAMDIWVAKQRHVLRQRDAALMKKKDRTEKSLEDEIKSQPEYEEKNGSIQRIRAVVNKLHECVTSMDERARMLMKLGKRTPEEEVQELSVRHRIR